MFGCFYFNRDALNLLKKSPAPKETPVIAAPAAPSPFPVPPSPGSRPNIPPLSVPGKPGAPVSTPYTISFFNTHISQCLFRSSARKLHIVSHSNPALDLCHGPNKCDE